MTDGPPVRSRAWRWPLRAAASLLPAAALALGWLALDTGPRTELLARLLYWAMPFVVGAWAWALVRRERAEPSERRLARRDLLPLVVAAVATAAVFVALPPAMRMQFDETSLVGTSQGMHRDRAAHMAIAAAPAPTGPVVTEWLLDKRPPLFPFLVSVLHDVGGERVANAFVVNAAVLLLLLAALARRARRAGGVLAMGSAVALPLAVPLVPWCATSAGFELLAAALLTTTVLAALDFVQAPSAARATWLLANVLLFAQARYESILVAVVLVTIVAVAARRWPRDGAGRVLLLAAPTLLTPLALLVLHARDPAFYPEARARELVAVEHLAAHALPFVRAWFDPALTNPLPGVLGIASALALLVWVARRGAGVALWLALAPVLAATAIVLAWFYGGVAEATALRLFLPVALLGALGPLLVPRLLPGRVVAVAVLVGAAVLAVVRIQLTAGERVLPRHPAAVALEAIDVAMAGLAPDPRSTLIVSTVAQYLVLRGHAATTPNAFARTGRPPHAQQIVVLETPLDAPLAAGAGDPRALLQRGRATLLGRIDGNPPIVAWRLEP